MKSVSLKEVCDVFGDGDWIESKDQSDGGIRLIQTGNVGVGVFKDRIEKARWISQDTFKRLRCTEIREGDVLISRLPDPVGRSCLIPALEHKAITAVDCSILRFDPDKMNSKFFIYYSQSSQYVNAIEPLISGSTRQRISREKLGTIQIPLPSLEKQLEIVEKLDSAFAEIELLEKNLELSNEKANQLCQSMLSVEFNPNIHTEEFHDALAQERLVENQPYEYLKLSEVTDVITDGSHNPPKGVEYSEYLMLSSRNVFNDSINFEKVRFLSKEDFYQEDKRTNLRTADVLLTIVGTIGRSAVFNSALGNITLQRSVAVIRPVESKLSSRFLMYSLQSMLATILSEARGVAQQGFYLDQLRNLRIFVPSIEKQGKIVKKLDSSFAEIELLRAQFEIKRDYVTKLRQSLLSSAFAQEDAVA